MIRIDDDDGVRLITLDRPEALNAFNNALYDAAADALIGAAADRSISVAVITGTGRAFSAGQDIKEMAQTATGNHVAATHGFPGFIDALTEFPKPLICAVNGMGLGVGGTMLAFADLVFMSTEARIRLPFTDLAVAPEAASSVTFPRLLGRQWASWMLLSSSWLSAEECKEAGLAWKVCAPDELVDVAMEHARLLASKPLESLMEVKAAITAGLHEGLAEARDRENAAFQRLLGSAANLDALRSLGGKG